MKADIFPEHAFYGRRLFTHTPTHVHTRMHTCEYGTRHFTNAARMGLTDLGYDSFALGTSLICFLKVFQLLF